MRGEREDPGLLGKSSSWADVLKAPLRDVEVSSFFFIASQGDLSRRGGIEECPPIVLMPCEEVSHGENQVKTDGQNRGDE